MKIQRNQRRLYFYDPIFFRKYSTAHYDYDYTEDEGGDTTNNNPGVNDVNNPATYNFSNPSALSEFSNPANNDFPGEKAR